MPKTYIFESDRLGFRRWKSEDLTPFYKLNADSDVMEHFPKTLNQDESDQLVNRLIQHFDSYNYTYYAVDLKENNSFIGIIGLCYQTYDAPFSPNTDIGWRLKKSVWGKGYATEGAKRCLKHAFDTLNISQIVSVCTKSNKPSEHVMEKIGMIKQGTFFHPKLTDYPNLHECLWYSIENPNKTLNLQL